MEMLDRLLAGTWPAALRLELLEASAKRTFPQVKVRLDRYEASRKPEDPLARWRECLEGGDSAAGHQLFWVRVHASCHQCHRIGDEGGTAGPPLSGVGGRQTREGLLESLITPSRSIAAGYETVALLLDSDAVETGRVVRETAAELVLLGPDGKEKPVSKDKIRKARRGMSAMPDDLSRLLTRRELRDLVEYRAGLK